MGIVPPKLPVKMTVGLTDASFFRECRKRVEETNNKEKCLNCVYRFKCLTDET
jgi:hypothetical protein